MDKISKFVERLKEIMIDRDKSAVDVIKELGLQRNTFYRYLRGEQMPSLRMAILLSNYFGCSIDYLIARSDDDGAFSPMPMLDFATRLKQLLEIFDTTKYQLSKHTLISESQIYHWQNGDNSPTLDSIVILADYFECSIEFILGRSL